MQEGGGVFSWVMPHKVCRRVEGLDSGVFSWAMPHKVCRRVEGLDSPTWHHPGWQGRVKGDRVCSSVRANDIGLAQALHKNMIFLNFNHVKNNPTQAILLHVLYMLTCALKKDCCSFYRLKINHVTAVNVWAFILEYLALAWTNIYRPVKNH